MNLIAENRNSSLVEYQVPDFVREDHPIFIEFLEAYYEWMEQTGNLLFKSKNHLNFLDLDKTLDAYIEYFRKEYAVNFPSILAPDVDKRVVLKNLKDFYQSRGSEKSYKLLFRLLFDTECNFYYPNRDLLRADDGDWIQPEILRGWVKSGDINQIQYKEIVGQSSGASAFVENVFRLTGNGYVFYEIQLIPKSNTGTFESEESVICDDVIIQLFPLVVGVEIDEPGSGYIVGEEVVFTDPNGTGFGATGKVKAIDLRTGGVRHVQIDRPGANYSGLTTVTFPTKPLPENLATGTVIISGKFTYPGYFLDESGQCDAGNYLQDDYFYQQFSYVVESSESVDRYREVVKKLLHPAGLIMFGQIASSDEVDVICSLVADKSDELLLSYTDYGDVSSEIDDEIYVISSTDYVAVLGPQFLDIDRWKFHYLPSSKFPDENDKFVSPNADYWNTSAGYGTLLSNMQVKDLKSLQIDDFIDNSGQKQTNIIEHASLNILDCDTLRLDYSAITDITLDLFPAESDTLTLEDTDKIAAIEDFRVNLDDFTASGANRPTLSITSDGIDVMTFNGSNELACTSTLDDAVNTDEESLFVVFETSDVSQSDGYILIDSGSLWALRINAGYLIFSIGSSVGGGGDSSYRAAIPGFGAIPLPGAGAGQRSAIAGVPFLSSGGGTTSAYISTPINNNTRYLIKILHQNDRIYFTINNKDEYQVSTGDISTLTGTLKIGTSFTGKIARIIVADAPLSYTNQILISKMLLAENKIL